MGEETLAAKVNKKKEVEVEKRDHTKLHFSKDIVAIAVAVTEAGLDPATCSKDDILKHAGQVLKVVKNSSEDNGSAESAESTSSSKAGNEASKPFEPNYNIPVLSLLISAEQLVALDKSPGVDKRRKMLADLVKEFSKYT